MLMSCTCVLCLNRGAFVVCSLGAGAYAFLSASRSSALCAAAVCALTACSLDVVVDVVGIAVCSALSFSASPVAPFLPCACRLLRSVFPKAALLVLCFHFR